MKKLITESNFDIESILVESESGEKKLYIEGIFATAEQKNRNGRIYPKAILEREVEKISQKMKENRLIGELSHPENRSEVDLKEAAIRIVDLNWQKNDVLGKALVLNTPSGNIIKALHEGDCKYGISSRALGTVSEGRVNEDLDLKTWDVVDSPSNIGSWVNGILEGVTFKDETDINEIEELKQKIIELEQENLSYKEKIEEIKKEISKRYFKELTENLFNF
jgi:hypothetical protein